MLFHKNFGISIRFHEDDQSWLLLVRFYKSLPPAPNVNLIALCGTEQSFQIEPRSVGIVGRIGTAVDNQPRFLSRWCDMNRVVEIIVITLQMQ